MSDNAENSMTTMTSSKPFNNNGGKAELFADSFDSWIEPAEATSHDKPAVKPSVVSQSPVPDATNSMKWAVWTESQPTTDWPAEAVDIFENPAPARPVERLMRGTAWAVAGLVALLLIVSLFSLALSRLRQPAVTRSALPKISMQKRLSWHKVMEQNAFDLARWQAKNKGRTLSANEKQGAAQKSLLQTVNAGGPDYASFSAAKTAGALDNTLWTLALKGATKGGTLPPPVVRRATTTARRVSVRRTRVARLSPRRTPETQPQAVILGRGPVRENSRAIIVIRD